MFQPTKPRFISREDAREKLKAKVATYTRAASDPKHFATTDPRVILADAVFRLQWIDCAPEGANHQIAPMMDKTGTPLGGAFDEAVGPGPGMRAAYAKRALPGQTWVDVMRERHLARAEARHAA